MGRRNALLMEGVVVSAGQAASASFKPKPTRNLSAQLADAEWLMSMPGTEEQKAFLLTCNSCHTLERIVKVGQGGPRRQPQA